MRVILFGVILVAGVTFAFEKQIQHNENNSKFRTKRILLDGDQQTQIKEGFDAATHLFDKMDKLNFGGVMGTLVGSVSSFLGAVSPFVGFVLSFLGGPSAEYQLLKRMFTQVENRFDQVDVQFAALRRQVAFVATQVHFTDLESNINAVQSGLKVLSQVSSHAKYRSESHEFIHTFDRTYESSGIKLYNAIIHGGLVTGGLFHEFLTQSTYDRKATQRFMIGTLNLLMRASALEMTYAQLKHDPNIQLKRRNWISHFAQIKSKMMAIDNEIVKNYHTPLVSDINAFATMHPKGTLSNADFSSQLYSKLSSKYYWRDWFVLVAASYDHKKFVTHACDYKQHDNHGRTINVASVDKSKHHVGGGIKLGLKLYTRQKCRPTCGGSPYRYHCADAGAAYDQLPDSARNHCDTFAAAGVVCISNTDVHFNAAPSRLTAYSPHHTNKAFLFS